MATTLCIARLVGRGLYGRYTLPKLQAAGNVLDSTKFDSKTVVRYAASGTAGKHWKFERVVTVGLIVLIPAAVVYPSALVDYGLALTVPIHGHWGLQAILEDYGSEIVKKIFHPLIYVVTLGTVAGLFYLNYADVGICQAVRLIWSK